MKLISSKLVGRRRVFDISVTDTHNFVGNGIVVHNCTESGAQRLFKKAKPTSITDIAALTSVYRPGPLAAKVDELYLGAKAEPEKIKYVHPLVKQVLEETYGCVIFQESVMECAHIVAGFPRSECDKVRKAIMKRSISGADEAKKKIIELKQKFIKGSVERGLTESDADSLFETLAFFSGYGFNKCFTSKNNVVITDKNGKFTDSKPINKVSVGEFVLSCDEKTRTVVPVKVNTVHKHGKMSCVRVKIDTGELFECTWDHKFRTKETGEMLSLREIVSRNLSIVVNDAIKISSFKPGTKSTKKRVNPKPKKDKRV